ncbi:MAG: hypothetical protein Q9162_001097 [Coniocarpon cinnabarinum]
MTPRPRSPKQPDHYHNTYDDDHLHVSDADDDGISTNSHAIASDGADEDSISSLPHTNNHGLVNEAIVGSYRGAPSPLVMGLVPSNNIAMTGAEPAEDESHLDRLTQSQIETARNEHRSLLRDNDLIPPKHPRPRGTSGLSHHEGFVSSLRRKASYITERSQAVHDEEAPNETTSLLGNGVPADQLPYGGEDYPENIDKKWEEAVTAGLIQTTWKREAKVLTSYSQSLIVTFVLQYSLTVTSVFTVGHIGKVELGAVSLGTMTANITGFAVYQGLATSLDTLCAQAYGSGKKQLVGLNCQRMFFFLVCCTIPIVAIWCSGAWLLSFIVPDQRTAELAGLYLRIVAIGTPGYCCFESGKRFVQAQGLFTANLYVLLFVAPTNVLLHWLFVWRFEWGYIGAPVSVAIIHYLLPISLFTYVRFVGGRECWGGFSRAALKDWGPMIRLAVPGLIMVLAEYLAFEILTLAASRLGETKLAAQSVVSTITCLTWQIPFPISIAASTRIANLIGATLAPAAKVSSKVSVFMCAVVGIFNMALLSSLRWYVPRLFTSDEDVVAVVANVLPVCAAFQWFDALAASANGILRGIGRQEVGGYAGLLCYYGVALPISFGTCFGLGWDLHGLWFGPVVALALLAVVEGLFIRQADWNRAVEDAKQRNAAA